MVETRPEYKSMTLREWFDALNEGRFLDLAPPTPLRREQTVEDIAEMVLFLLSEEVRNISGQTVNVDGGRNRN